MTILVSGSLAFDTIMLFEDHFKKHIAPEHVHVLSVSFTVTDLKKERGGCAGNIAYSLALLGATPLILASVGEDFTPYRTFLEELGVDTRFIREMPNTLTAQAFITTDLDDNQITAFHPGAMLLSHETKVPAEASLSWGIVAPAGKEGMKKHARELAQAGIPFIFDPGQGLPLFSGEELLECIELANMVAANDYEMRMIVDKTGLSVKALAERVDALIVTLGGKGSVIYHQKGETSIPAVPVAHLADPTGCGDAYRAGLLYGFEKGCDLETSAKIASLMGAIKISCHGPQGHTFTPDWFFERFFEAFGYRV